MGYAGTSRDVLETQVTFDFRQNKRFLIIYSIILLHNFRTEYVGFNQIATIFDEHYEQYINVEGYDRIARYFAF